MGKKKIKVYIVYYDSETKFTITVVKFTERWLHRESTQPLQSKLQAWPAGILLKVKLLEHSPSPITLPLPLQKTHLMTKTARAGRWF